VQALYKKLQIIERSTSYREREEYDGANKAIPAQDRSPADLVSQCLCFRFPTAGNPKVIFKFKPNTINLPLEICGPPTKCGIRCAVYVENKLNLLYTAIQYLREKTYTRHLGGQEKVSEKFELPASRDELSDRGLF